jgi:ADP-dependent NAD(P)H-hydrate dehydratase / NAD(P)H-hydrate epimerase
MKITTAAEMRTIDRVSGDRFGVPSLTLMENAGTAVAECALEHWPEAERIMIVCGKGNNGGDGFVAARKLTESGKRARVLLLTRSEEVRGDAAKMLPKAPAPLRQVTSIADLRAALREADLIIDAVLGTGFQPPVEGLYREAIEAINAAAAPVLAVDIPSGADADAFVPQQGTVICRADVIVTFTAPRPAHVFGQLTRGPVRVVSIGSPKEAIESRLGLELITPLDIAPLLAARRRDSNKGSYGHVLVVGGSIGKTGAAGMAGLSALRAGTGLATIATPRSALPMVASIAPELMTEPLAETEAGSIAAGAALAPIMAGKTVVALGPGISRQSGTVEFVRNFVRSCPLPLVIDADGLNAFEGVADGLSGKKRPLVLTPHPGEMSRLTGLATKDIQSRRIPVARDFARSHDCVLVLKGSCSLVASPDERIWINPTGNAGMATGGTGDVLTGVVAGMIAQHSSDIPLAVAAAVYLHGLAGDLARDDFGEHSLIATDLLTYLPDAFLRAAEHAQWPYVEF